MVLTSTLTSNAKKTNNNINGHPNGHLSVLAGPKPDNAETTLGPLDTYGFPGANFKVHFFDLEPPDLHRDKTHYEGFHPSRQILEKGHVKAPGLRPFPTACHFERDVGISMRDGVVIYTDVFRPVTDDKVPAILPYSPYGKSGTGDMSYDRTGPYNCGIDPSSLSGYHKFEGPDPAEWVPRGYAIVNVDARGAFDSEGHMMRWGPQEALDVYDTIEWIIQQPWSNGCVTMCGNSWLAVSQINHAARCPHPALKCIAPWEGHADHYRDVMVRGGIPQVSFGNWMQSTLVGRNKMEDTSKMALTHPLFDDYWATKRIPVENIDIPMYCLGSYSSFIHTHGSARTYREAKSKHKWIRFHNAQEWADLYKPRNVDELQRFYDRYCKGIDNGWERETPPVRITMISFTGKDIVERPEPEFPLAREKLVQFNLDSQNLLLSAAPAKGIASASYEAHHLTDCLDFELTVDRYTEICGYPMVKLWMSCSEHDDLDIRVQLRKKDAQGNLLHHYNYPPGDPRVPGDEEVNIFKFLGSTGMLRASHRVTLNKDLSTVNEPFYDHDRREAIPPGEIVPLYIGFWPTGMVLDAGEKVVLRIAGHSLVLPEFKVMTPDKPLDFNKGRHNVHTGGAYDSHLLLPIINY